MPTIEQIRAFNEKFQAWLNEDRMLNGYDWQIEPGTTCKRHPESPTLFHTDIDSAYGSDCCLDCLGELIDMWRAFKFRGQDEGKEVIQLDPTRNPPA